MKNLILGPFVDWCARQDFTRVHGRSRYEFERVSIYPFDISKKCLKSDVFSTGWKRYVYSTDLKFY